MDYETQELIETMYNRNQKRELIRHELKSSPEIYELVNKTVSIAEEWKRMEFFDSKNKRLEILDEDIFENFYLDLLGVLTQRKMAQYTEIVGSVRGHIRNMDDKAAIRTAGELISLAVLNDLIVLIPATRNTSMQLVSRISLEERTEALIKQYQYLPPMVVPPRKVKTNSDSGYLTIGWDSLILKGNHHEEDICLDHINRSNSVALSLDTRVIRNIRDNRKHLDAPKENESIEEYEKRVQSFLKMEKDSMRVFAMLVNHGNRFYLTHKYDKRGRTYCQGHHTSYQGSTYRKAIIELADKEIVPIEE